MSRSFCRLRISVTSTFQFRARHVRLYASMKTSIIFLCSNRTVFGRIRKLKHKYEDIIYTPFLWKYKRNSDGSHRKDLLSTLFIASQFKRSEISSDVSSYNSFYLLRSLLYLKLKRLPFSQAMPSSTLLLGTASATLSFISKPSNPKINNKIHFSTPRITRSRRRRGTGSSSSCRASASSSSWVTELDLYELLGVESSSDQSEIKKAYRALQKKCHPDIAGDAGHDMAIILNEVYSLLSDPHSRSAYDQEQAKLSEFSGYTGKPLYSTWFGSKNEQRAVFVDEVKCVGCLKCALYANKTFAIESVYGRARVIAQWADSEDKIFGAIETCPVDCISIIERSNLAALEFLMSKQPRGNVRMTGGGNTGGTRVSNIFVEVNKFQTRFGELKDKALRKESKEPDRQRESRISAVQGIRSISNWWYWQSPSQTQRVSDTSLNLIHIPRKSPHPNTRKLQEAAAKLKSLENSKSTKHSSTSYRHDEEYWTPVLTLPSPTKNPNSSASSETRTNVLFDDSEEDSRTDASKKRRWNLMSFRVPIVMAVISSGILGSRGADMSGHVLTEHIGGSRALQVINSFEMQVVLAGVTWFVIGMGIVGIFEVLGSRKQ